MRKTVLKIFLLFCLIFSSLLLADTVFALDTGVEEVDQSIALEQQDPRETVGRIINIALMFLGIIALGIILYAGFLWMTSGGNEEQIGKAKKTLINGVIGLIIVLSSWGIASFVLNQLADSTGSSPGSSPGSTSEDTNLGLGALGACSVESVYPSPKQEEVAKNTSIIVEFKKKLDPSTICNDTNGDGEYCNCNGSDCDKIIPENIQIYKTDIGNSCETEDDCTVSNVVDVYGQTKQQDGNTILLLTPENYLDAGTGEVWYSVNLNSDILDTKGDNIFKNCDTDYLNWQFEVIDELDLTPPKVEDGGVFPAPDNEPDEKKILSSLESATASIEVTGKPTIYTPAEVENTVKNPVSADWSEAGSSVEGTCNKENFTVTVEDNDGIIAKVYQNGDMLDSSTFIDNSASFDQACGLTLTVEDDDYTPEVGHSWTVDISTEIKADTLTLVDTTYVFADDFEQNHIKVDGDNSIQASNIVQKISGNDKVEISKDGNIINLTAREAGEEGNEIRIGSNSGALNITEFSGGSDEESNTIIKDKADQPRNAMIQINFNEAINPVSIEGNIRVINNQGDNQEGESCSSNSDCLSYNCVNSVCQNNSLPGEFKISNKYKTLEFISDQTCGVNGCGEKIYCLPSLSNLEIAIEAASLKTCSSDGDCMNYSPYTNCNNGVCQNEEGENLATADSSAMDGIMDASLNSLDGNRDGEAQGPVSYYNLNTATTTNSTTTDLKGDNFAWSFFISDKLKTDPPKIESAYPALDQSNVSLSEPITIEFNELMSNSSLSTGTYIQEKGDKNIEHKLINLRTASDAPVGYWIENKNLDKKISSGGIDRRTQVKVEHSLLPDTTTHVMQVGSGIKDIYQNCFKPSAGPACTDVSETEPSCCFGTSTSETLCNN